MKNSGVKLIFIGETNDNFRRCQPNSPVR